MNSPLKLLLLAIGVAGLGLVAAFMIRRVPSPAAVTPERVLVAGTPSSVSEAIVPEIRDRIAQETKLVRVDRRDGVTLRFSVYLEDHSVRLVEIDLAGEAPDACSVSILSRRFSFLPGGARDHQDLTLEASLRELVRRATAPKPPGAAP